MTDDRRRAGSTAPPPSSAEPSASETLPYAHTIAPASPPRASHPLAVPPAPVPVPQPSPPQPLALQQTEWQQPRSQHPPPPQPLALQQTEWQQQPFPHTPPQHTPLQHTPLHPHASHPHTPVQHTPYEVLELPRPSAVMPLGSVPPERGPGPQRAPELPYAPTVTPMQLHGSTLDIRPPSKRGTPAADGTLDLPASDRVDAAGSLDPGQKIGRFVIRSHLGEGGMGIVLAGHDPELGRPVAIKLVKPEVDRPAYRTRLLREAQALGRLEHPNVVRVYEVGSDRGRLFVAMELVDGVTLSEWLRARRRPWREVLEMFQQIGAGLAAVHRAGLIHRDFKPDNVLVDRDGRARVADFGLARLDPEQGVATARSPELAVSLTRSGVMLGTPGYMAPEQQYGGSVDTRADQYSFCVALREALAGNRTGKLDDASWGDVPYSLREVIARGLAYEAKDRFASMDALLLALRGRDRRRGTAFSVAVAVVAIAGGIATTMAVMSRVRGASTSAPAADPAGSGAGLPDNPTAPAGDRREVLEPPSPGDRGDAASPRPGGAPIADGRPSPSSSTNPGAGSGGPGVASGGPGAGSGGPGAASGSPGTGSGGPGAANAGGAGSGSAAALVPGPPVPGRPGVTRAARRPEAWPSDPGHLAVVRATIQDLGYDGFDPGITASEVEKLSGIEQVIGKVKLGMVERRAGRCATAVPLFTEARQALPPSNSEAAKWRARASIAQGLCALAAGHAEEGNQLAMSGWVHGNQDEVSFVMALAAYEKGEMQVAQGLFFSASLRPSPTVRAAVQTWLDRTGLVLP